MHGLPPEDLPMTSSKLCGHVLLRNSRLGMSMSRSITLVIELERGGRRSVSKLERVDTSCLAYVSMLMS